MRIDQFMSLNESIAAVMTEAQDYESMFTKLIGIIPADGVKNNIEWAKRVLKKKDKITWYLIQYRKFMADRALKTLQPDANDELRKTLEKYVNQNSTNGMDNQVSSIQQIRTQLEHFMSLQLPEIENIRVMPNAGWIQFRDAMRDAELKHQDKVNLSKQTLRDQDEGKIIMEFGDGFAWWNLNKATCRDEGSAMGHCGNAGTPREGDRILSLRHKQKIGNEYGWRPVCTFILDKDNYLGEMKGRANEKPSEKYHKYIIALLKNADLIKGIKGGGYKPEANFSMDDLTNEERAEVIAANPALEGEEGSAIIKKMKKLLETRPGNDSIQWYEEAAKIFNELGEQTYARRNGLIIDSMARSAKDVLDDYYSGGRNSPRKDWLIEMVFDGGYADVEVSHYDTEHFFKTLSSKIKSAITDKLIKMEFNGSVAEYNDYYDETGNGLFEAINDLSPDIMGLIDRYTLYSLESAYQDNISKAVFEALEDSLWVPLDVNDKWDGQWAPAIGYGEIQEIFDYYMDYEEVDLSESLSGDGLRIRSSEIDIEDPYASGDSIDESEFLRELEAM